MNKIKILYISHSSDLYGAEVCLLTLLKYLDRNLFEPVVILPSDGPLLSNFENLNVTTYLVPLEWCVKLQGRFAFQNIDISTRVQKIIDIIRKEKPHIVHSNTSVVCEGAIAAKLTDLPHIWHVHEILKDHPSLSALVPLPLLYEAMGILSEKVVLVSDVVKNNLLTYIPPGKLLTIHNGIDTSRFNLSFDYDIREKFSFSPHSPLVLTIGSLSKEKNHETLIEAASLVKTKNADIKFLIAGFGSPDAISALQEKINTLGLNKNVFYLGYREDIPGLLAQCDLLVHPSLMEAFPLAILEGMAAGKPVIATDSGGPSEMIVNGLTGYIVPLNNSISLAHNILDILSDKMKLKLMGENGFKRFNDHFKAEGYADQFVKLYKTIADSCISSPIAQKEQARLEAFLEAYQNYIEKMRQLHEHNCQIEHFKKSIDPLIADRDAQKSAVEQLLKTIDSLIIDRDAQKSAVEQLQQMHAQLTAEHNTQLAELSSSIAERDLKISAITHELQTILSSRSWKITVPLRAAWRLFR